MKKDTPPEAGQAEKEDNPRGFVQSLKDKSIKAAGAAFLFADSSLILSGLMQGNRNIGLAGVFGLTAGAIGTRYGNPKAEKQLEHLNRRLGAYLQKQGVTIPKDPSMEALTKQGGIIDHIESFFYANPSQIMNVFYSLIGVQFAQAGLKKPGKDYNLIASGALLITGALAGILIPERKPDPNHPPKGALQKAWSKIEEKPLRLTGTLFNLNQVSLALSALNDRRTNPEQKSWVFKLLAVAGFTFGNTMLAISSRSHAGGKSLNAKSMGSLAELSARVIAAQPPAVQNTLLEQVSGFLSSQPNIHMNAGQISAMLHQKIMEIAQTPPAQSNWQGRISDAENTPQQPAR